MTERELDLLADRLEDELIAHRIMVRVVGATVSAHLISFDLTTAPGVKLEAIRSISYDLARAMRAESVRVSQNCGVVIVEIPRPDVQPLRLLPMLANLIDRPPVTAVLGTTSNGSPLLLKLPSPDVAHVLVAGTTGSGKTVLLRSIILSLALRHVDNGLGLFLIDPRGGVSLNSFNGLPQLMSPVLSDSSQIGDALEWLTGEMERRDAAEENTPSIVVVIDELADLLVQNRCVESSLTRLVARGRGAGIHVIAATQRPAADAVSSMMKANFPVRLVGRVASPEDARVAAGQRATGAEKLAGRGDFVAVTGAGVIRFHAALVTPDEIDVVKEKAGWLSTPPPLPVMEKPVDSDLNELAERLAPWWKEHGGEWGSKTQAVHFLFGEDAPAGGAFWDQTVAAIRMVTT